MGCQDLYQSASEMDVKSPTVGWRAAKYIEYAHNFALNCLEPPTARFFSGGSFWFTSGERSNETFFNIIIITVL